MRHTLKLLLVLLSLLIVGEGCFLKRKTTCPAYMKGSVTGMSGSKGKKQELFPRKMRKRK